jgi:hypothetical protein
MSNTANRRTIALFCILFISIVVAIYANSLFTVTAIPSDDGNHHENVEMSMSLAGNSRIIIAISNANDVLYFLINAAPFLTAFFFSLVWLTVLRGFLSRLRRSVN